MKLLSLDTETSLIPAHGTDKVNTSYPVPEIACASWAATWDPWEGQQPGLEGVTQDEDVLCQVLERFPDHAIVFHNGRFDLGVFKKCWPKAYALIIVRDIYDTVPMFYLRYPNPQPRLANLARLVEKYLGRKVEGKTSTRLSYIPGKPLSAEQRRYAIQDAKDTLDLALFFLSTPYGGLSEIGGYMPANLVRIVADAKPGFPDLDLMYSRAATNLHRNLECHGIQIDRDKLAEYHSYYQGLVFAGESRVVEHGLARLVHVPKSRVTDHGPCGDDVPCAWHPADVGQRLMKRRRAGQLQTCPGRVVLNMDALRQEFEALASDLGIEPPVSEKTQAVSTSRDDWKDYEHAMPANLKDFMALQKARKYVSSYTRPITECRSSRLFPSYAIPGTATLRWAAFKHSIQNNPKAMRDMYVAKPGHKLVYCDYPSLELYTLGATLLALGIDGPLQEALKGDPHVKTSELVKCDRQEAKAGNYGLPGGMMPRRFAAQYGLSLERATELRNQWFGAYPDVDQYLRLFKVNMVEHFKPRYVTREEWFTKLGFTDYPSNFALSKKVHDGRLYTVHCLSGAVLPQLRYSAACNTSFQTLGGHVITHAFNLATDAGLRVVAVVHDEIVLEAPDATAEDAGDILRLVMRAALQDVTGYDVSPDKFEVTIAERWSK